MTFQEDITNILRAELGEGFESANLRTLYLAYLKRQVEPKLRALYALRVDRSVLESARDSAAAAITFEEERVKTARDSAEAQAETDIASLTL